MGFVVLHMEKAHGSDSGTTAHIEHFIFMTVRRFQKKVESVSLWRMERDISL